MELSEMCEFVKDVKLPAERIFSKGMIYQKNHSIYFVF